MISEDERETARFAGTDSHSAPDPARRIMYLYSTLCRRGSTTEADHTGKVSSVVVQTTELKGSQAPSSVIAPTIATQSPGIVSLQTILN